MQKISKTTAGQMMSSWLQRNFSDPAAISLLVSLLVIVFLLELFGSILAPILVSVVIAYMLHILVLRLVRIKVPHILAVMLVFILFLMLLVFTLIWLLPLLSKQLLALVNQLPHASAEAKSYILHLAQRLPEKFAPSQLQHVMSIVQAQIVHLGRYILSFSLATIPGIVSVILYLVLVPVMVFFFLKDSDSIGAWFKQFLPENRQLIDTVIHDVHGKIGQYIRGRILEIVVVGLASGIIFSILGLPYAILLACVVGVSVIIPYVGAVVATVPVVVVGLMQWGFSSHFVYLLLSYAAVIFVDANVLVPLLFAETMDLHPVAIIISVLVFGSVWGFWGVFFAIPLVTLAKSILDAWPRTNVQEEPLVPLEGKE